MVVRIRSLLVSGPIVVPLNTGQALRLSPGQTSDELPSVEVADNAKVEKLRQQGVIAVETDDPSGTPDDAAAEDAADDPPDDAAAGKGGSSTRARKRAASS